MGLLDYTDDPQTQGLLSLGLRLMSTPGKFGQAFGQAGQGALADMARVKAANQESKQAGLRDQLLQMQIAQAQQQQAQQAEALKQREAFRASIPSPLSQANAVASQAGPLGTKAAAAAQPKIDPMQALMYQALATGQIDPMDYIKAQQKDETPIVIPENGTLATRSGKVLATGAPKNDKPSALKEYEYAQMQGYKGSLTDWMMEQKKAGAPSLSVKLDNYMPASEEAQRDFIKGIRTRYDALQSASTVMQNIERAKTLVPTARGFMGPLGEQKLEIAKFFNQNLGTNINPAGIKDAEELRSRLFVSVMENLKKMDASPSQYQQQVMQDAFGKLGTDPNAVPAILDVFGDLVRGKVDIHNKEVADSQGKGVKYPYDPMIKLPATAANTANMSPDELVKLYRSRGR